jgi:hypothetical protein
LVIGYLGDETYTIEIRAPLKDREGNQYSLVAILEFNVENGIASLSWINENPILKIVTQREK